MKQVFISQGQIRVDDAPEPVCKSNSILVRVAHSCVSAGTETSNIKESEKTLWKRAIEHPENVKKVFNMISKQGLSQTRVFLDKAVSSDQPTGYSLSGTVIDIGSGINDVAIGGRVACVGAQCAYHAEIVCIPKNLYVPLPGSVSTQDASTVALGAIALQGIRRAQPTLGETFVVIGLGLLGQITIQILAASGCRVIGIDVDRRRITLAKSYGIDAAFHPDDVDQVEQVIRLTDGNGADGVVITAGSPSSEIAVNACKMCRKKGRVVMVGNVGLDLVRREIYYKELDLLISMSYGPGRYESGFEEKGLDYPIHFVRWTETRNMQAYIDLLAKQNVRLAPMLSKIFPISDAHAAYEHVSAASDEKPIVLLSYPEGEINKSLVRTVYFTEHDTMKGTGKVTIAVAGAGNFSKLTHLPNIRALSGSINLHAVMSASGHNATSTAKKFGAHYATTDYAALLSDPAIHAVLISTRHNLHARMTLEALRAGKHVLVEKPLCLNREELKPIEEYYSVKTAGNKIPLLLTGFNRRFSPIACRIKEFIASRSNPIMLTYRMNAGHQPSDKWVHGEEGGGRNIGEACHIYDLFTYFTESTPGKIDVSRITPKTAHYRSDDNFIATITFNDGSVCSLVYTALGSSDHPKEQMELFVDGTVIAMDDYKKLKFTGSRRKGYAGSAPDKGHREEIRQFANAIKNGGEWPSPLWQQLQAMEIAFSVQDKLERPE